MNLWTVYLVTILVVNYIRCEENLCNIDCPNNEGANNDNLMCGLDRKTVKYYVFPDQCAFDKFLKCNISRLEEAPMEFCVKAIVAEKRLRRSYLESCPVFCPSHYRPVCGATETGYYNYRTFNNACQLDIVNCRGNSEMPTYIEIPLKHCSRHLMKNIFAEQMIFTNVHDYPDYF